MFLQFLSIPIVGFVDYLLFVIHAFAVLIIELF